MSMQVVYLPRRVSTVLLMNFGRLDVRRTVKWHNTRMGVKVVTSATL